MYWFLHAALLGIGGDRTVLPFDTYRTGLRFTTARTHGPNATRFLATALHSAIYICLLPDSPRALLACFSIYVPRFKCTGPRRSNA
eukprot:1797412-Pleurochrysis_carterae.AAC.1